MPLSSFFRFKIEGAVGGCPYVTFGYGTDL